LLLYKENGILQQDTTDGRHVSVCGVHHMKYLEMADRLGRDFCKMQKFVPGWSFLFAKNVHVNVHEFCKQNST